VLTESLAATLLLAALYAHTAALAGRITVKRLAGMLILDSLLVLIKPNFIFLPTGLFYCILFISFQELGLAGALIFSLSEFSRTLA
jgi:hypothetical protein